MSLISAMRTAQTFVAAAADGGVTVRSITVYSHDTAAAHIDATPDYLAYNLNVDLRDARDWPPGPTSGPFRNGDVQFHGLTITVYGKRHEGEVTR